MEKFFYNVQEMKDIRDDARDYALEMPAAFLLVGIRKLQGLCNGCGPERWPEIIRKGLTEFLWRYETAFAVHDVAYSVLASREEADKMLLRNMKRIFRKDYGLLWFLLPHARIARAALWGIYATVKFGGGKAFDQARKKEVP